MKQPLDNAQDGLATLKERGLSRQHLVQDQPERKLIDAKVTITAVRGDLLRRHVAGRTQDRKVPRERRPSFFTQLRDAKVEDLHPLAARSRHQKHVARLEIAMNHAQLVGGENPFAQLFKQAARVANRQRTELLDLRRQRRSFQVFHHQKRPAIVGLVHVHNADDVRAAQPGQHVGFATEALDQLGTICQLEL